MLLAGDMQMCLPLAIEVAPFYRAGLQQTARQLDALLTATLFHALDRRVERTYRTLCESYIGPLLNSDGGHADELVPQRLATVADSLAESGYTLQSVYRRKVTSTMTDNNDIPMQYVYGIISCKEPREFGAKGIGGRGDTVHTLHYRDLAAVLSDSAVKEYDNSRRNMMAHMVVLEELMRDYTVLPVRFGTVAPKPQSVIDNVLAPRYDELIGLLAEDGWPYGDGFESLLV